jgi:hypothetical protein
VSRGWFARLTGRIGCHPEALPVEFRRKALDLVAGGRTVVEVDALLGTAESCQYRWKSRDLVDRGLKPGTTSEASMELPMAQRIRDLEEEVKILCKAAAVEPWCPPKSGSASSPTSTMTASGWAVPATFWGVSRSGYYE